MKVVKLPNANVNLCWTTDWHFSDIAPGRRKDDYCGALLRKLEFVRETTEKIKGAALCGGDVFHIKNPISPANSFNLLIHLLHSLRRFPFGCVFGAIGNHDLYFDRMESLPNQPLGLLIAAGVYHNLVNNPILFTNEMETVKVLVETFPYAEGEETLARIKAAGACRPPDAQYRIGIVHAFGTPGNRGTMFGTPKIGYNEVKDVEFDFLLWGHDHARIETETVGNVTHINLGSMARAAFDYDEIDRPVVAALLSFSPEGIKYKEKAIPVTPLEIAFTSADKGMERVPKSDAVTDFFSEMDMAVDGIESSNPRDVLKKLCNEPKLLNLALELCGLS